MNPTREIPTHSPAPWQEDEEQRGHITSADGLYVAEYALEAENRRLILKAPDLLATCRALVLRHEAGMGEVDRETTYAVMKALVDEIDGVGAA
jgi:hypothetical protein